MKEEESLKKPMVTFTDKRNSGWRIASRKWQF
jgi:hypothetical protein